MYSSSPSKNLFGSTKPRFSVQPSNKTMYDTMVTFGHQNRHKSISTVLQDNYDRSVNNESKQVSEINNVYSLERISALRHRKASHGLEPRLGL